MTNLPEDLQRILNVGAKVYNTKTKKQGKVIEVEDEVVVDYGNSAKSETEEYLLSDFKAMLLADTVVANYRLTIGSGDSFKVRPREGKAKPATPPKPQPKQSKPQPNLETGYINFKTGKFSTESKRGYTKVEYRKATQKVTLEIDDEALAKLKEMGLV